MRNPVTILARVLLAMLGVATPVIADESMRCGTWIVTSEATVAELVQKCGEPASKDVSTADVYAKGPQPNQTRKVGVTTTERWTYDRGPQAFRMIATIVDGQLKSIDRAR